MVGHIEAPPVRSFRWAPAFGKAELGVVIFDQTVALGRPIGADDPSDPERARMAHQFLQDGLLDEATAQTLHAIVAKGAMPPLVLGVDDCRAAYERMHAVGVEFTQEPTSRYGKVDASFRDPSGNGWKMIEARR